MNSLLENNDLHWEFPNLGILVNQKQSWLELQSENIACLTFKMNGKYWNLLIPLFILGVKYGNGMSLVVKIVNGTDAVDPIPWQVCCLHRSTL